MEREKPKYKIVIGSPIDYDELVAYVRFESSEADAYAEKWKEERKFENVEVRSGGELVAIVSKEEGPDKIKVELFGLIADKTTNKIVDFDTFIEALQEAKASLVR